MEKKIVKFKDTEIEIFVMDDDKEYEVNELNPSLEETQELILDELKSQKLEDTQVIKVGDVNE